MCRRKQAMINEHPGESLVHFFPLPAWTSEETVWTLITVFLSRMGPINLTAS